MTGDRGALEVEDLLKIVLLLVAIWLVLEIVGEVLSIAIGIFGAFRPVLGVLILVVILLWYFDKI